MPASALDEINLQAILPAVERIAENPTKWERLVKADAAAREFLQKNVHTCVHPKSKTDKFVYLSYSCHMEL